MNKFRDASRLTGKIAFLLLVFFVFAWSASDTLTPRPTMAQTKLTEAITTQKAGRFAQAVILYDEALAQGADKTLALGGKAECLYYLQRNTESLAVCDELAKSVPNAGRANYIRGLILLREGFPERAYAELRWAVAYGEADAESLLPKGK